MKTQNTIVADTVTYNILINEQQRRVLHAALQVYISAMPCGGEHDEFGSHVAGMLEDMLDPDGSAGSLQSTGINSFVM